MVIEELTVIYELGKIHILCVDRRSLIVCFNCNCHMLWYQFSTCNNYIVESFLAICLLITTSPTIP